MRKLEVRKNGYNLKEGWQVSTISQAEFGDWEGIKYLDLYFHELPEQMNMRVWATHNKTTGEEFAIGNLFRFANAGLGEVALNGNGRKVVSIHDNPDVLIGKKLNIFLYRDDSGYFRILPRSAPAEPFENHLERMSELDIEYWKEQAQFYFDYLIKGRAEVSSESTPF